jgi:hypothetical protein
MGWLCEGGEERGVGEDGQSEEVQAKVGKRLTNSTLFTSLLYIQTRVCRRASHLYKIKMVALL